MHHNEYITHQQWRPAHINTDFDFGIRAASCIIVAHHEAGHLAGMEAEGLGAGSAKVYFMPTELGRPAFWSGSATMREDACGGGATPLTPERRMQTAVVMLCGRAAEVVIANAEHLGTPLEVVSAVVWATRGGAGMGLSMAEAMAVLAIRTARIIHGHRAAIEAMAKRLGQRKVVTHRDRRIAQALTEVRAAPQVRCTAAQVDIVASLIPSEAVTMAKLVLAGNAL